MKNRRVGRQGFAPAARMLAGRQVKSKVVPWAVDLTVADNPGFQVLALVGTAALDNKKFPHFLNQYDFQTIYLDCLSIAIMEVDQFFQGEKAHALRLRGPAEQR